jgi:hypothetical protein
MRRGDVRRAVLSALREGPAHGYEIMRRLESRSGGMWRPSPGSVYPTLQMLEDEGMVRSHTADGTRVYELTDAGRDDATGGEPGREAPWDRDDGTDGRLRSLRDAMGQTIMAARHVARTGSPEQIERGVEIVQRARKDLYQLLAGD